MATVAISPPPRSGNISIIQQQQQQQPPWKSNAVNRSNEFLSCTRTALKIAQQQYHNQQQMQNNGGSNNSNNVQLPEWMINITPNELNLYQYPTPTPYNEHSEDDDDTISLIQDSQTLLNLLDTHLSELNVLVRRRGHTNDPTLEIQSIMEKFQEGAKEIKDVCDLLRLSGTKPFSNSIYNEYKRSSSQRRKHYELLSQQLESQAKERTDQIKKELETRSKVLRDQTQRRKLLATGVGVGGSVGACTSSNGVVANGSTANRGTMNQPPITTRLPTQKRAVNTSSQFQSPLFTTTQPGVGGVGVAATARNNATSSTATKNGYSGYAGYGGAQAPTSNGVGASRGYAGYGGATSAPPSFATGMRQRKGGSGDQQSQQPKSHIQIDNGSNEDNDYEDKYNKNGESSIQAQILQRRTNRATKNRAAQARLAEKSIAELGVMFTKMSSLISQQGEVLERIEDDVEAAGLDIDAGHDELVKVYGMTKGNRGLIIKIFGILIFLIIFMKLYER